jgi:adenylosuccinate synthase
MGEVSLFADTGVHSVVDGQFGSTGKGVIAAWLAREAYNNFLDFLWVVSNAGPNSGHTFYHGNGKHVLKQLPTFAVAMYLLNKARHRVNTPDVYLSAGAIIDVEILAAEALRYPGLRIFVHPLAAVIRQEDKEAEHSGSIAAVAGTRSGTGAALARKVMRERDAVLLDFVEANPRYFPDNVVCGSIDVPWSDSRVFMEVSQGFSLGLNSHFYPKVTSRECTVMQGIADARLPPASVTRTFLSMRTFPIRVGNVDGFSSGKYYPDQKETSWEALGQTPELTTVTQRIRRVFTFSYVQASEAIAANHPDFVFINFMNYLDEPGQQGMLETLEDLGSGAVKPFGVITCSGPTSNDVTWLG